MAGTSAIEAAEARQDPKSPAASCLLTAPRSDQSCLVRCQDLMAAEICYKAMPQPFLTC
jgi:hypothetical protein